MVPEPPPPELPVLKKSLVVPDKGSPVGFCPLMFQKIVLLAGNAGFGVQVSTVLPELHAFDVERMVKGDGTRN